MEVLYIGGAGRSGSTLLEMILGNLPGFFSIGEARYYWEYIDRGDIMCGCGNRLSDCRFWSTVSERLDSERELDFAHLAARSARLNRTRNLPWITKGSLLGSSREWEELAADTGALYRAVWKESGDRVLVDSSKVPSHLALLRHVPDIDLRVLHLVRDGRAVAYSWNKRLKQELAITGRETYMSGRSLLAAMLVWIVENAYLMRMCRAMPHVVMRYEDFVEDPQTRLEDAVKALGFGEVDLGFLDQPKIHLDLTHSVGGNPIRFSRGSFSIVADREWHDRLRRVTALFLGLVGLPLLFHFGYDL